MDTKKKIELIKLEVLGCLNEKDYENLRLMKESDNDFPWKELGEYQNLAAMLPATLTITYPGSELKDKTARKLYDVREEIRAKIEAKKAKEAPPKKIEEEKVVAEEAEEEEAEEVKIEEPVEAQEPVLNEETAEVEEKIEQEIEVVEDTEPEPEREVEPQQKAKEEEQTLPEEETEEEYVFNRIKKAAKVKGEELQPKKLEPFRIQSTAQEKSTSESLLQDFDETPVVITKPSPEKDLKAQAAKEYLESNLEIEIDLLKQSVKQNRLLTIVFFIITLVLIAILYFSN
jgi:hypothetical protein